MPPHAVKVRAVVKASGVQNQQIPISKNQTNALQKFLRKDKKRVVKGTHPLTCQFWVCNRN